MPSSARRRLEALEARQSSSVRKVSAEALSRLSGEELDSLFESLCQGVERGQESFEDLYAVTSERSRRALERLFAAIEAVRRGEDPPGTPRDREEALQALQRLERICEGDEEARREYEKRNGYRIWKYYKKEKR